LNAVSKLLKFFALFKVSALLLLQGSKGEGEGEITVEEHLEGD
jgi:hypothetical protein